MRPRGTTGLVSQQVRPPDWPPTDAETSWPWPVGTNHSLIGGAPAGNGPGKTKPSEFGPEVG